MKSIKKLLYKLLGQDQYLQLLSLSFPYIYKLGLLKNNPEYDFHYFVKKLIKPSDTVVDIGANLGYYSSIFAGLTQNGGQLISIEPVLPFYKTLLRTIQPYSHCSAYNYALGKEDKQVVLTIPGNYGYIRTGLASVTETVSNDVSTFQFPADMKKAATLFAQFPTINYIKCDIEGYESIVIPELKNIFEQQKPLLQIETTGENKLLIQNMLEEIGYTCFSLYQGKLIKNLPDHLHYGDYLFVPKEQLNNPLFNA